VRFSIQADVPTQGKTAAERAAHDKRIGAGTMSRSGATCPCCGMVMTTEDIRLEGQAGRLGAVMTTVVVDGDNGKEYRLPTAEEIERASEALAELPSLFADIPFGLPEEPTPKGGSGASRAFSVDGYGFDQWYKLFTPRQLLALGTFVKHTRAACHAMAEAGYPAEWVEAVEAYLALGLDRLADYSSSLCSWHNSAEKMRNTFGRFALPIIWDFTEVSPGSESSGSYLGAIEWIARFISHPLEFSSQAPSPYIFQNSATQGIQTGVDIIVTDPPYYDAIPYSDLMDFFYVWLRRTLHGLSPQIDEAFSSPLSPKWDHDKHDGELIDDASRFGGDKAKSKAAYEDGMARAFQACHQALAPDGRLVIVFAHKQPDAWETLVSAIIRAGFVVDGSWPIQTEMGNRTRALASAALSSSVWLVCKKRPEAARPGWDNRVLEEMREKITTRLRDFWDAGIRGPDFVWAATGPALEAYSQYPVVKKANEPGQIMTVSEFLRQVRRMVVDFVVGRVLTHNGDAEAVSGLDDLTTYYLLHRHDFGLEETPIGPCILYAVSCGLSDSALVDRYDLLVRSGGQPHPSTPSPYNGEGAGGEDDEDDNGDDAEASEGSGSKVKLRPWQQRKRAGQSPEDARPIPLIDQTHRLMHLWRAGDVTKVDEYLEMRGLRRNVLFHHLLQSLIELAPTGSEERSLLESISNHLTARGLAPAAQSATLWSGEEQG
jgi:putative DNA methylase